MEEKLLSYEELALKRRKRSPSAIESGYNDGRITARTTLSDETMQTSSTKPTPELTTYGNIKLGWIQGVLIPCLLNIWGVMLFLRVAWVVAQAGIALTILIIFISGVVCVITTLSLSAICTNGELQGGGVYFLVSRSLGAELGASVGLIFAFANSVAASMNTIGFCDSLNQLLKTHSVKIFDNGPNDTRIIGAIALLVMCVICAIGMDWETKTQNFLIIIIVTAIVNYLLGAAIGPLTDDAKAQGFGGISMKLAIQNWMPDFRYSEGEYHNFFSVFAVYFPAVTGVQAGANICGDLKDPATAIPKGTLLALGISLTSYLAMATLAGAGAWRDASGSTNDLAEGTLDQCKPNCEYGLHNNYEIMNLMSFWGPLIYAGCWAATLSTALTNLLSVPRLIQALGLDRIYPGLIFFSKRYGRHGEPYRGYVLTFLVSVTFLLIADLNTIAPLITNFYLASYALINFCTFHGAFFKPISWRPRFQYYNTWLSLIGFILCVVIMMIISWVMALITTFIFITLYLLVLYRKPEASWGSSREAQRYQETITNILEITKHTIHIKSFNPQLLVLAGRPEVRPWLLDMAALITCIRSFMIVADIEPAKLTPLERIGRREFGEEWIRERNLRGFFVLLQNFDHESGMLALLQAAGLGHITPNLVLMGHKHNWDVCPHPELLAYCRMVRMAFEFEQAVAILRVPANMRPAKRTLSAGPSMIAFDERIKWPVHEIMNADSDTDLESPTRDTEDDDRNGQAGVAYPEGISFKQSYSSTRSARNNLLYRTLTFNQNSILDAWWLYDDGGMNILLPYIIARRASKDKMALRIFVLPRSRHKKTEAEQQMADLLKKLRIQYSKLILVEGIGEKPSDNTWALFHSITENFKSPADDECLISNSEFMRLHEKTCRYLRLRELLLENSVGADLIVMTLPFPRKNISAAIYMAWLEMMGRDMPPIMFVRGNSKVVLDG